jgi:hypothetical protein
MDFTFNKEQSRFRQEVRDFLKSELEVGTFSIHCRADQSRF